MIKDCDIQGVLSQSVCNQTSTGLSKRYSCGCHLSVRPLPRLPLPSPSLLCGSSRACRATGGVRPPACSSQLAERLLAKAARLVAAWQVLHLLSDSNSTFYLPPLLLAQLRNGGRGGAGCQPLGGGERRPGSGWPTSPPPPCPQPRQSFVH